LKLNGTHQFLVYADGVNILGESLHAVKKNSEACKEIGREINFKNSKYLAMSREKMWTKSQYKDV
jgi:hypothetical protein